MELGALPVPDPAHRYVVDVHDAFVSRAVSAGMDGSTASITRYTIWRAVSQTMLWRGQRMCQLAQQPVPLLAVLMIVRMLFHTDF